MSNSRVLYLGDGATARFAIPFPYLSPTHVHVYVNKVEQVNPLAWTFDGDGFAVLSHTPAAKDAVEIIRITEGDIPLSQFQDGSILTEAELNLATLQNLYLNQELRDYMDALLDPAVNNIASNLGVIPATAGEVIDSVVQGILGSELLADLQQRITDIDTNAAQLSGLYTTTSGISAALTNETNTRTDADSALAEQIDTVQSNVDANHALIATEQSTRADADSALSTRIDAVLATTNNNTALIQTEQQARADGDSANATAIQTVQTAVDGNTSSIETMQTSMDGVLAEYTLKLDVNGYVIGMGLINNGTASQIIFTTDKFAIVTPGKTPVVPFSADANGVYMDNAYIRNLAVDKITGGAIKAFFNIADATGRIVLDTGTYMKVLGSGFGLNADLIEWFGPKMDVGSCTRANAITYVATNGDAYFGGSLSAGTLYNAVTGTSTQTGVDVIDGPFGSNGGSINVVVSYTYAKQEQTGDRGQSITAQAGTTSAHVQLYRTVGAGAEALVWEGTFIGSLDVVNNGTDAASTAAWRNSGSATYTDTAATTDVRTYRAIVTTRTLQPITVSTGGSLIIKSETQKVSIVCTEQ